MKRLIVTADDFGISRGTNHAVERAHRDGILSSASLMINMPAAEHAIEQILPQNPRLGVGLHWCLTSGPATLAADEIPLLVDRRGVFKHGLRGIWRLVCGPDRAEATDQIRRELEAQLETATAAGVDLDHVDGHQHVHMIPGIFQIVAELLGDRPDLAVRMSHEPLAWSWRWRMFSPVPAARRLLLARLSGKMRLIAGDLWSADAVYGVLDSGRVNRRVLMLILAAISSGVSEVIVHPSLAEPRDDESVLSRADRGFLASTDRATEYAAICDEAVAAAIARCQIVLVTHREAMASAVAATTAADGPSSPAEHQATTL